MAGFIGEIDGELCNESNEAHSKGEMMGGRLFCWHVMVVLVVSK
jgi:hypothetical protein